VSVIAISLFLNKDEIASDIIKAVMLLLAGGIGGYGLGTKKDSVNTKNEGEPKPQK